LRKIIVSFIAVIAVIAVMAGLVLPATAVASASPTLGCNGEEVQKKPGIAPPFRYGQRIHFGYAEWFFPPSCRDEIRRDYVKVYKIKAGKKDPKVYATTGDRESKRFKKGKYRVKVRYAYRYWDSDTGRYGRWNTMKTTKIIRIR